MKKFTLFFFFLLTACASAPPAQVSEASEVLPATPPPTDTPAPTLTPTPIAVDGVATIDGIHYIFDETMQNWVALPELDAEFARVLVTEDGRIVAVDANGAEVYALDMATGEWVGAVTFEPMTLETDPSKMGVCTYEDITSGRLDWSVDQAIKNGDIVFPEDAHNGGWENRRGENSTAPMFLSSDSSNAMKLVNLCKINGDFLDLPDRTGFVASVAVLNTDGTYGVINFMLVEKAQVDLIINEIITGKVGIRKVITDEQVESGWDGKFAMSRRLYRTQGANTILRLLDDLQSTGIVPEELSKFVVNPSQK